MSKWNAKKASQATQSSFISPYRQSESHKPGSKLPVSSCQVFKGQKGQPNWKWQLALTPLCIRAAKKPTRVFCFPASCPPKRHQYGQMMGSAGRGLPHCKHVMPRAAGRERGEGSASAEALGVEALDDEGRCTWIAMGRAPESSLSPSENQSAAPKSCAGRVSCQGKQASAQAWKTTWRPGPGVRPLRSDLWSAGITPRHSGSGTGWIHSDQASRQLLEYSRLHMWTELLINRLSSTEDTEWIQEGLINWKKRGRGVKRQDQFSWQWGMSSKDRAASGVISKMEW